MPNFTTTSILDRFLSPLADCLTKEAAARIVEMSLDPETQGRLDELAAKANNGELSDQERREYEEYVEGIDVIGILKAKARSVLSRNDS